MQTCCRGNLQREQQSYIICVCKCSFHCVLARLFHQSSGHSLGCEVSVGRLQVDLRGSSSSGPMWPSVSLFKIIQLVRYKREINRQEEERYDREVTDDGWVSELVRWWTVIWRDEVTLGDKRKPTLLSSPSCQDVREAVKKSDVILTVRLHGGLHSPHLAELINLQRHYDTSSAAEGITEVTLCSTWMVKQSLVAPVSKCLKKWWMEFYHGGIKHLILHS